MGSWVYKGQYAEDYPLDITHFAYHMCKSAESVRHNMVSCIECIVESYVFNKTLTQHQRFVPTICTWIFPVLESRNIVAILLGGNLKEAHNKRLLAERCLAAAVQLGVWQAYIGYLWCSLSSELCKHHYSDWKWEIPLDCFKDAKNRCSLLKWVHQAPVFCSSCVPQKVSMNQKGINQKWYFHKK
jgi:hypothetical protein